MRAAPGLNAGQLAVIRVIPTCVGRTGAVTEQGVRDDPTCVGRTETRRCTRRVWRMIPTCVGRTERRLSARLDRMIPTCVGRTERLQTRRRLDGDDPHVRGADTFYVRLYHRNGRFPVRRMWRLRASGGVAGRWVGRLLGGLCCQRAGASFYGARCVDYSAGLASEPLFRGEGDQAAAVSFGATDPVAQAAS